MPLPAYAQNAEDVMLWRLFKDQTSGVYVDVGAQHPEVDSVTKRFYDHGWSGLNIEPVSDYHEALKAERPRDINLDVLVGAIDGELTFYHVEGTGLSTTRADLAASHAQDGRKVITETLPIFRLQTLFERHGITTVDFLKVDTEGSEADVLMGLDFGKIRPKVLVIESTLPNSREESHHEWEPRLLAHGYHLAYRDGLNRFYLDTPYLDWMVHFELPPNHFDDYLPALAIQEQKASARERAILREISEKAQAELLAMARALEGQNEHLRVEIARQVEHSGWYHRSIIETLQHEIGQRDHHIAHLNAEIARISGELAHVRRVHERAVRTLSWRLTAPFRVLTPLARDAFELASRTAGALASKARSAAPASSSGPPPVDGMPEAGRWLAQRLRSGR